jgi:hypothetical protein
MSVKIAADPEGDCSNEIQNVSNTAHFKMHAYASRKS